MWLASQAVLPLNWLLEHYQEHFQEVRFFICIYLSACLSVSVFGRINVFFIFIITLVTGFEL